MKILFVSDLHGKLNKYRRINEIVVRDKIDVVINGGDILPHGATGGQRIAAQKAALADVAELIGGCEATVYMQIGNDDLRAVYPDIIEKISALPNVKWSLGAWLPLGGGLWTRGYEHIPDPPFSVKDWAKLDGHPDWKRPPQMRPIGRYSTPSGFVEFDDDGQKYLESKTTIAQDLDELTPPEGAEWRDCILTFHSPPADTPLDLNRARDHVGSRAIKAFIEKKRPLLTLHGHIHETVEMSGEWKCYVNETLCATPGQTADLSYIIFHARDPIGSIMRRVEKSDLFAAL